MEFILIRKDPWGEVGNRVIAPFKLEDSAKRRPSEELFVCAIVKVTEDFKEGQLTVLTSDTDAIQIRPKQIFKNTKGYYYQKNGVREYIESWEVEQFLEYIKEHKAETINKELSKDPKKLRYGNIK